MFTTLQYITPLYNTLFFNLSDVYLFSVFTVPVSAAIPLCLVDCVSLDLLLIGRTQFFVRLLGFRVRSFIHVSLWHSPHKKQTRVKSLDKKELLVYLFLPLSLITYDEVRVDKYRAFFFVWIWSVDWWFNFDTR